MNPKYPFMFMQAGDSFTAGEHSQNLVGYVFQYFYRYCEANNLNEEISTRRVGSKLIVWKTRGCKMNGVGDNLTGFEVVSDLEIPKKNSPIPKIFEPGQDQTKSGRKREDADEHIKFAQDMELNQEKQWIHPFDYSNRIRVEKAINEYYGTESRGSRKFTSFKRDGKIYFKRIF